MPTPRPSTLAFSIALALFLGPALAANPGGLGKTSNADLEAGAMPQGSNPFFGDNGQLPDPLPGDEAFVLDHFSDKDSGRYVLHWNIAPGYYLYHDKFSVAPASAPSAKLALDIKGEPALIHDAYFGDVKVHYHSVDAVFGPVPPDASKIEARWQGCSEIHQICYPPERLFISLSSGGGLSEGWSITHPETFISDKLAAGGGWLVIVLMFLAGVALGFTPCVLPMIPILTAILGGEYRSGQATQRRLFLLGLTYVLAMALSFAALGVAVGLSGQAFAAQLQSPAIIAISAIIVATMALWLMGLVRIPVPAALSTAAQRWQARLPGGSYAAAALAGVFASLVVSPCISPPLVAALIYVSHTGEWLFGGLALLALGLGMGTLVIAACLGAQQLLPRAGPWMASLNLWLGMALLLVALWLADRIFPAALVQLALALALLAACLSEGVLDFSQARATRAARLYHGFLVVALLYAMMLLAGLMKTGLPWSAEPAATPESPAATVPGAAFTAVSDLDTLQASLASGGGVKMLDVYADWCASCIELEAETFTDPQVAARLEELELLRLDVTEFDASHQKVFASLGIFGPPALLFFDGSGEELSSLRIIGFISPGEFADHLDRALAAAP